MTVFVDNTAYQRKLPNSYTEYPFWTKTHASLFMLGKSFARIISTQISPPVRKQSSVQVKLLAHQVLHKAQDSYEAAAPASALLRVEGRGIGSSSGFSSFVPIQ